VHRSGLHSEVIQKPRRSKPGKGQEGSMTELLGYLVGTRIAPRNAGLALMPDRELPIGTT
jgi:hypothetical protein